MAPIDPLRKVERLKKTAGTKQSGAAQAGRIPPGQHITKKFPVLTYGETPVIDKSEFRLNVWGLVENPLELTWDELMALPKRSITTDIHCVTTWSMLDTRWTGIPFQAILEKARPLPEAKAVMQHGYGGYTTNLLLKDMLDDDVLLAYEFGEKPLAIEHGGPLRMLVPKLYFWKSTKWLNGLEFIAEDAPGFWERNGYHMHGDPWTEERFG
ncbi:MAG TPA: sulfite oxidase-like oxidoreductase [Bacteroidetes bacterium]|nr:sulfite oxidase-like oxidoreductase [Bacteroidota bacterium]